VDRRPEEILSTFEKWAEDFKAIAHPLRMAILFMLYGSEVLSEERCLTVSEIRKILAFPNNKRSFNKIEHHLSVLLKKGFIERFGDQEQKGKSRIRVLYRTSDKAKTFLDDFNLDEKIRHTIVSP